MSFSGWLALETHFPDALQFSVIQWPDNSIPWRPHQPFSFLGFLLLSSWLLASTPRGCCLLRPLTSTQLMYRLLSGIACARVYCSPIRQGNRFFSESLSSRWWRDSNPRSCKCYNSVAPITDFHHQHSSFRTVISWPLLLTASRTDENLYPYIYPIKSFHPEKPASTPSFSSSSSSSTSIFHQSGIKPSAQFSRRSAT